MAWGDVSLCDIITESRNITLPFSGAWEIRGLINNKLFYERFCYIPTGWPETSCEKPLIHIFFLLKVGFFFK